MSVASAPGSIVGFYEREVAPSLYERLDEAFPEFNWKWDGHRWVARQQRSDGVKRKVVCSDSLGFRVEGGEAMTWLAYVSGGANPRGPQYVEAVRKLASLAGLEAPIVVEEPAALSNGRAAEKAAIPYNRHLLEAFHEICRQRLHEPSSEAARAYLRDRWGFDLADRTLPIGYYAASGEVLERMIAAGFTRAAVEESGLVGDDRCDARLILPARDLEGRIVTFFARQIREPRGADLRLCDHPAPVLWGLDVAIRSNSAVREDLLVVRDRFDACWLHARGITSAVAIASWRKTADVRLWQELAQLGVESVTLAIDYVETERELFVEMARTAARVPQSPAIYLFESTGGETNRWQTAARSTGTAAFRDACGERLHLYSFLARGIVRRHYRGGAFQDAQRESILGEANRFCDQLPLGQEVALNQFFWPVIHEALPTRELREDVVHPRVPKPMARKLNWTPSEEDEPAPVAYEPPAPRPKIEPRPVVTSVADEWSAHANYLERCRRREYMGVPQRTLPSLDRALCGLRGLSLLAGAPGVGKTAFAVQLASDAVRHNVDTCAVIVSLDMPRRDLLTRLKAREAGVDWQTLVRPEGPVPTSVLSGASWLDRRDLDRHSLEWLRRVRIVDRTAGAAPTGESLLQELETLRAQTRCERAVVVIDDLQGWTASGASSARHSDAEQWEIVESLKRLRDAGGDTAVIATCETNVASSTVHTADLVELVGSARLAYAADTALVLRSFTPAEIRDEFAGLLFPTIAESRWLSSLKAGGIRLAKLHIVKGREGVDRTALDLAYQQDRFAYSEDLPRWEEK